MKQYVDSLKQIAEKHEWKQVSETEHSITYSPDGMDGWAFSGMNLEYAQHRLAFFRKNRLISENQTLRPATGRTDYRRIHGRQFRAQWFHFLGYDHAPMV